MMPQVRYFVHLRVYLYLRLNNGNMNLSNRITVYTTEMVYVLSITAFLRWARMSVISTLGI